MSTKPAKPNPITAAQARSTANTVQLASARRLIRGRINSIDRLIKSASDAGRDNANVIFTNPVSALVMQALHDVANKLVKRGFTVDRRQDGLVVRW